MKKSSYEEAGKGSAHQNIARAVQILDVLAHSGKTGMRQTDIVQATGLQKSVVHRALAGLTAHGMAAFDETSSRFYLGDRMLAWMYQARERFALAERVMPHLKALVKDMFDTMYFSIIRGDEAICFSREEGSFPVRALSLEVGAVRPLGVGSGSLAIFAFQSEAFRERVIAEHAEERLKYNIDDATLLRNIQETREKGYSLHKGVFFDRMKGLGVPVFSASGACAGALSTTAISERLVEPRAAEVAMRMQAEAKAMQEQLGDLLDEILPPGRMETDCSG